MLDINLILENIVYLELLRRGFDVTVGRNGNKEIDFVCNKQGEKIYIQVTYLLASQEQLIVNSVLMIVLKIIFQSTLFLLMNLT